MTAISIIKQMNAVHMLADGASWFFGGGFGPACCKAWPIPHLRAVVSGRGPRLGPMLMADFLNAAGRSYGEMKNNAAVMARELFECHRESLIGKAHPLNGDRIDRYLDVGLTIDEMLQEALKDHPAGRRVTSSSISMATRSTKKIGTVFGQKQERRSPLCRAFKATGTHCEPCSS